MKVHRLKVETEAQFQHVQDQMYQEARAGDGPQFHHGSLLVSLSFS